MKLGLIIGLLISVPASVLSGPHAVAGEPKAELETIRAKYQLPALGAAVVRGGHLKTYMTGYRKWKDSTAAKPDDQFHLGSCTKAMTATLIALYVERGLLRWDARLPELFPELEPRMNAAYKNVTLQMLTAHRSGISGDLSKFDGGKLWNSLWDPRLDPVEGRKKVAASVLAAAPASPPGSKFEYSNTNYMIAGAALERVAKMSWERLIRDELFKPLEMSSCGFGAPGNANALRPDEPWGHKASPNGPVPIEPGFEADNPPTLGPAGTVHCAMADWAKFLEMHVDGLNGKSTKMLKAESFKKLHESYPGQEYTYGAWIRTERSWGGTVYNHTGSNNYNFVNVWLAPQKDLIVLVTTNYGGETAFTATDEAVGVLINATHD